MRAVFCASVAKNSAQASNEDAFAYSEDNQVFAVSDGASVSFDSASWAKILVSSFVEDPVLSREWATRAISRFTAHYERDTLAWNQQAAFDRGSFATLLGVHIKDDDGKAFVTAVGDSIAILVDNDRIVSSFPLESVDEFGLTPVLLSTSTDNNGFLFDGLGEKPLFLSWHTAECAAPEIICMTDAVAAWFLSGGTQQESPLITIRKLRDASDLTSLVHQEVTAGRMRRDDVTVVRLA